MSINFNSNEKRKSDENIVEEVPHLRSMAVHSPAIPLARGLAFHEPSQKVAPPRVAPFVRGSNTEPTEAQPQTWVLHYPLAVVPYYYQLDRTHVYIAELDAEKVAQNVADCLRTSSIASTFHQSENKIDAETCQNVKFTIRLWSDQNQVVVEIQRRSGCCFLFCEAAKLILRAARGSNSRPSSPRSLPVPLGAPAETEEAREVILAEGLHIVETLLRKDRIDAHLLAMESLVQLSRASYSRSYAARYIFKNDTVLLTIQSLIEFCRMSKHEDASDDDLNDMEKDHFSIMHRHALTVLNNCLGALEENSQLEVALRDKKAGELLSKSFVGALVNQVFKANEQPHDACQAVQCLRSLIRASDAVKQVALQLDAPKAIFLAQEAGLSSHCELQRVSSILLPEL